jgi:hypothetical protein
MSKTMLSMINKMSKLHIVKYYIVIGPDLTYPNLLPSTCGGLSGGANTISWGESFGLFFNSDNQATHLQWTGLKMGT